MFDYCVKHNLHFSGEAGVRCPQCIKEELTAEPEKPKRIAGLDLAKVHDYTAMTELEVGFHHAKLVAIKVWPHIDYSVIVEQVADRYHKMNIKMVGIDATGVGEPISEMFRKVGVKTDDIKFGEYVDYTNPWGYREHASVKYAMVEYARACGQSGFVEIHDGPNTAELKRQMSEQYIKNSDSERTTYSHPESRHDDLFWAFLINLYVSRRYITGTSGWIKAAEELAGKSTVV